MFVTPRSVSRSRVPWIDAALTAAIGTTPTISRATSVFFQNLTRTHPPAKFRGAHSDRACPAGGRGPDAIGTGRHGTFGMPRGQTRLDSAAVMADTTPTIESPAPTRYSPERLFDFSVRVFEHFGVPAEDARTAATVLQAADLRGVDSHGVARLHSYYDMLTLGRIEPRPKIAIVRETVSTATVDGGNGLGLVVGPRANALAMAKAESSGSGWVSVRNTNHFGIAGYYVLRALERDLIGWAMTNSTKLVVPLWDAERMLGTKPVAIAFPGGAEPPIVIDMATCAAAYGKI